MAMYILVMLYLWFLYMRSEINKWWLGFTAIYLTIAQMGFNLNILHMIVAIVISKVLKDVLGR